MRASTQRLLSFPAIALAGLLLVGTMSSARADRVELVNGDSLSGELVSIGADHVVLKSRVLGTLKLNRKEVARIDLGDAPPRKASPKDNDRDGRPAAGQGDAGKRANGKPADVRPTEQQVLKALRDRGLNIRSLADLKGLLPPVQLPPSDRPEQTPEDVIRQLRTSGLDPRAVEDVQRKLPLLAIPGVRGYFDKTVSGLISGEMTLQDLRRDAQKARDGLLDIKKDLGPSGDALNGYLMILEGFLDKTSGPQSKTAKPPAVPKP